MLRRFLEVALFLAVVSELSLASAAQLHEWRAWIYLPFVSAAAIAVWFISLG